MALYDLQNDINRTITIRTGLNQGGALNPVHAAQLAAELQQHLQMVAAVVDENQILQLPLAQLINSRTQAQQLTQQVRQMPQRLQAIGSIVKDIKRLSIDQLTLQNNQLQTLLQSLQQDIPQQIQALRNQLLPIFQPLIQAQQLPQPAQQPLPPNQENVNNVPVVGPG